MKKITGLDEKLQTIATEEPDERMPTRRAIIQSMGNVRAETADDARRVRRILAKIRDTGASEIILENDDLGFMEKFFEKNASALPAWLQGQILDVIASAETIVLKAV